MRTNDSPFASFVLSLMGIAMSILGALIWALGGFGVFFLGLITAARAAEPGPDHLIGLMMLLGMILGTIAFQGIGAAMYFFSQTLYAHNAKPIPTHLLPRLWLAKFLRLLSISLIAFLIPTVCTNLFPPGFWLLPLAAALVATIRCFQFCSRQVERLSPPYPPEGPPFFLKRKSDNRS